MGREAIIKLNCVCEHEEITFLIDILCSGGWTVYNERHNIEYLPVGDEDDFDWKEDNISYYNLKQIVAMKQSMNELVGVHLFYKDTHHGIALLIQDLHNITISIDINRRSIGEERDSLTDFEWYFSNVILLLNREETLQITYKFEDYID